MRAILATAAAFLLLLPLVAAQPAIERTITPGAAPFNGLAIELADLVPGGGLEMVAQSDDGYAYVIDSEGSVLAKLRGATYSCTTNCYDFEGISGPIGAPDVGDLDGDGNLDIVLGNTAAGIARFELDPERSAAKALVFTKVWDKRYNNYQSFTTMDANPVVADLNGDGSLEVVVVVEQKGIFAATASGGVLWNRNTGGGHATPTVGDVDGDGEPEVVVARDNGSIMALSGRTGVTKWSFDARPYVIPGAIPQAPLVADLTGDGRAEVAFIARDAHDATNFANDHFMLFVLGPTGQLLWRAQPSWGAPMSHTRLIAVDVGGAPHLLGADWNTIGHKPGAFERVGPAHAFLYDHTGREVWHTALDAVANDKDLAVADVLGDGTQQVIAGGREGGREGLHLLDLATGAKVGFLETAPWAISRSAPAVGDLYGDGNFAMAVGGEQNGAGAILLFRGAHALSTAFPGWGVATPAPRQVHPLGAAAPAPPPTPPASGAFTFTPTGGNEWWVQLKVSPQPTMVQAMDTGGAWVSLAWKSWGQWAGSFHIEPGHVVTYRASSDGLTWGESCAYTHPQNVCSAGTAPPPAPSPPPPASGDSTFTPTGGNEWWVQLKVSPQPTRVQAMDTGGAWVSLAWKSWGQWAGSFHIEPGHVVTYRASGDGVTWDESCAYTHPQNVCSGAEPPPPTPPPTGTSFSAAWKNVRGNTWWVETDVTVSGGTLAGVDARVEGGAWIALTPRSYGSWAKSIHAVQGSDVEFRARATDGATATSATYSWPP